MWRATLTVAFWTIASRVLGFLRDVLIADRLGAGMVADAFLVALKLPNLFRRLFGEGAFNAAFVPVFTATVAAEDRAAGARLAGELAWVMLLGLGAITLAGEMCMPWLMRGFAPGFWVTPPRFALAVVLTRITFPYSMLICLAAVLGGVLNGVGRFAVAAATPILFNLVCIAALLGFARVLPTAGHALAWGVLVAGVLQLGWLALACRRAGVGIWPRPRISPPVRAVLRRMGPGVLGAGVTQLNTTLGVVMASLLPAGSVSVLYYADRVNQLPLGLIGAAMGTALLPALALDVRGGVAGAAAARLNRAVEMALVLCLPAAVALVVLARPIMQVLFGRGAFGVGAVGVSAAALAIYAPGLPAVVLARLFGPACFARGDTATPVKTALVAVGCNLGLGLSLLHSQGILAPPEAASVAAVVNAVLLGALLRRRGDFRPDAALRRSVVRIGLAALLMGGVLLALRWPLAAEFGRPGVERWGLLGGLVVAGLACFAASGQWFGAFDLRRLGSGLRAERAAP